ncbi:MAG: SH3 domain-containing protein [Desulfobacterales bacterium]|nr:MAG: SH3 domain-containing protein [Desulfobacterales bacterium]
MKKKHYLYLWLTIILMSVFSDLASAERLAVAVPVANVRSGPGVTYEVLWQIEKHHPLSIIKKSGSWYFFRDFEGDQGWIHKSLINKKSSIITKKEKSNIRSGPGTTFKILLTVEKGVPFKIINQKGSWIHIQHADGEKGWIHRSLVW